MHIELKMKENVIKYTSEFSESKNRIVCIEPVKIANKTYNFGVDITRMNKFKILDLHTIIRTVAIICDIRIGN